MKWPRIHRSFGLLEQSITGSDLKTIPECGAESCLPSLGRVFDVSQVLSGDKPSLECPVSTKDLVISTEEKLTL